MTHAYTHWSWHVNTHSDFMLSCDAFTLCMHTVSAQSINFTSVLRKEFEGALDLRVQFNTD